MFNFLKGLSRGERWFVVIVAIIIVAAIVASLFFPIGDYPPLLNR